LSVSIAHTIKVYLFLFTYTDTPQCVVGRIIFLFTFKIHVANSFPGPFANHFCDDHPNFKRAV